MDHCESTTIVEVSVDFPAFHCWPSAPDHRSYLRDRHRHVFRVTAWQEVQGPDREVEFHDLQRHLYQTLDLLGDRSGEWGEMSCEDVAGYVCQRMPDLQSVRVAEDEWCAATVLNAIMGPPRRGRPEIVTVCGSTRFADETRKVIADLELEGKAVFSVGFFAHAQGVALSDEVKTMLDELHQDKICMSDSIYVVNVGGYVGESTRREIALAERLGKRIYWLEGNEEEYQC